MGPGLILWHPKGAMVRKEIEDYERELILKHGYDLVYTPHIASEKLFEISGHLENYRETIRREQQRQDCPAGQAGQVQDAEAVEHVGLSRRAA